MSKNYNTPKYRKEKRLVSFVEEQVKKAVMAAAKLKKISISKEIAQKLKKAYLGK